MDPSSPHTMRKPPSQRRAPHGSSGHQLHGTLHRCMDSLRGTALRLTRNRADAEDLLHDAVVRAWSSRDRFDDSRNGGAWMHRILKNTFVSHYRRARLERTVMHEQGVALQRSMSSRPPAVESRRVSSEVQVAMDTLPENYAQALRLVDLDEMSYVDAAKRLQCPVGTVMSRLHRGRQMLRTALEDNPTRSAA